MRVVDPNIFTYIAHYMLWRNKISLSFLLSSDFQQSLTTNNASLSNRSLEVLKAVTARHFLTEILMNGNFFPSDSQKPVHRSNCYLYS